MKGQDVFDIVLIKMKDIKRIVHLNRLLLAIIVITVGFNILFLMRYNFQDDAAFYVTLAQEQLRTRSLFPEGMFYSSGLFVISPNLLVIPFLLVTDNLVLARQSAILLLWGLIYIILFKIFVTKGEQNIKGFVLASSFLSILYVNSSVVSMHFYQGAYVGYLLFLLLYLALMNKFITNNNFNNKYLTGLLILYIASNLGDIRNLVIWGFPGLLAYLIFVFLEEKKVTLTEKETEKRIAKVLLNGVLLSFTIFVLMGKIYGNAGSTLSLMELAAKDYGESLNHIFVGMFNLFGNSYSALVFSGAGIFKLINFLVAIIINIVVPIVAVKYFKNIKLKSSRFLIIFSLTSSLLYLFIAFITGASIYLDRYLIPVYNNNIILFATTGSFFLDKIKSFKRQVIGLFSVLLYVLLSNLFYFYSQKDSLIQHKYGFFASGVDGVVEFLESKGLQYGYATFTNAEEYSVLSNNKVRVRCVGFDNGNIYPLQWLTSESFYKPDYYVGNTFLMITEKELKNGFHDGITVLGQPKVVYEFKKFKIFVYDYNISNKFISGRRGMWLIRGAKSAIYVVDEKT
jgi:hypothetical protein